MSTTVRRESAFEELLALAPFRRLLAVRVCWTLGIQMLLMAIAWHAYEIEGDAWALALIGLCQFIPVLLFALPAGYIVDRYPRSRVIAASLALHALTALVLVLMAATQTLSTPALYTASVVLGVARALFLPALQSIVPGLVPASMLSRAMASVSTASQLSVMLGPALAGFLIVQDVVWAYGLSVALFALALALPVGRPLPSQAAAPRKISLETLFAGCVYIRRQPIVLGAISLDMFAVLFGGAVALLPLYVKDILGGSPADLGLLRAAPACGAVLAAVALLAQPIRRRVGRKLLLAVGLFGLAAVVFGLSRSFWLSALALAVGGSADMVSVVIRQTLVQLETPDAMRGRVSAVNAVFVGASNQLGEFQVGAAAALLGPVTAVVAGGLITALLPLLWWQLFPALARRDAMESNDARRPPGRQAKASASP